MSPKRPVWWCEQLGTVLANEEVVDGKSEVGGFPGRPQADAPMDAPHHRLCRDACSHDLDTIDWSDSLKEMQRNWIGRSEGAEVDFQIADSECADHRVFTTRPDTLFGATYMVLAPEHKLVDADHHAGATRSGRGLQGRGRQEERPRTHRTGEGEDRRVHRRLRHQPGQRGEDSHLDCRLRARQLRHRRDHGRAGARHARLRVRHQVQPAHRPGRRAARSENGLAWLRRGRHLGELDRRRRFRSLACPRPKPRRKSPPGWNRKGSARRPSTTSCATGSSAGSATGASRFPIVWKQDAGRAIFITKPCPNRALPLLPPPLDDYKPTADGQPPLARAKDWVNLPDGSTRETNTMPQWAGSCWYYLRYLDAKNNAAFVSQEAERYWMGTVGRAVPSAPRPARRQPAPPQVWISTSAAPSTPCCTCSTPDSGTRCCSTSATSRRPSRSSSSSTRA